MTTNFDTGFFVGGNGMFLQYEDVIKPVYLYGLISMIINDNLHGLPNLVSHMSIFSLIEWYRNRRYVNPLKQLDWNDQIPVEELDNILESVIANDKTICSMAPLLNISRLIDVYQSQYMTFPFVIYSNKFNSAIQYDIDLIFGSIKHKYVYGDLKSAIRKCDENFTYIFSNLEMLKNGADILKGTYSHVLLANDYRYNYIDNHKTLKYDMKELMFSHPFIRTGTTSVWAGIDFQASFKNIIIQGGG